jgi:hypothetical protein
LEALNGAFRFSRQVVVRGTAVSAKP